MQKLIVKTKDKDFLELDIPSAGVNYSKVSGGSNKSVASPQSKVEPAVPRSKFYFHPEDEKEARKFSAPKDRRRIY